MAMACSTPQGPSDPLAGASAAIRGEKGDLAPDDMLIQAAVEGSGLHDLAHIEPANEVEMPCIPSGITTTSCDNFSIDYAAVEPDSQKREELAREFAAGRVLLRGNHLPLAHGIMILEVTEVWRSTGSAEGLLVEAASAGSGLHDLADIKPVNGATMSCVPQGTTTTSCSNFTIDFASVEADEAKRSELAAEFAAGRLLLRGDHEPFAHGIMTLRVHQVWRKR